MAYLAKMTEMAINRQNRQTRNKNLNEMAKGPFAKWRFSQDWRLIAKIAKLSTKIQMDGKEALSEVAILAKMVYLAKMAEMALNRQNRQTVNKSSNKMAKGLFGKRRFLRKWRIWQK